MKNKKILFVIAVCGLVAILLPSLTFAATLDNPLGKDITVQLLIGRIISAVLGIVGSIALLMFIYGGFLWLTSSGNEQKITQGKNVLVWATIGLAVIFLSYTMVGFVIKGLKTGSTPTGSEGAEYQSTTGCCSTTTGCIDVPSEAACKQTFGPNASFFSGGKCDSGNTNACI